jgi:hypothetical protein
MNNRGQFFIIFAVLIGLLVLGITTMYNSFSKIDFNPQNFYDICKNYEFEIHKISELNSTGDIRNEENSIKYFTLNFTKYYRDKNYNISLIYVYSYNNAVNVLNLFDQTIKVNNEYDVLGGCDIDNIRGCYQEISYSPDLTLNISSIQKSLNSHDFYYLMQLKKGDETFNCESNENE